MSTFCDLGVLPALEKALTGQKITTPTPIQLAAIPRVLGGDDLFISSVTGSGKTLAYLLPILTRIDAASKDLQAVILAPTHELAMQIFREADRLVRDAALKVRVLPLIGGVAVKRQVEKLKAKPHLVVGSTGRILHLIKLRKLNPHTVRCVVVDEMDQQLYGDKLQDTRKLIGTVARDRQLLFVSATDQPESSAQAASLAPGLGKALVDSNRVAPNVEHLFLQCQERDKFDLVRQLVHALETERAMVFVHRNTRAGELAARLSHRKLEVADIHGARDKLSRQRAMQAIQSGRARVLIASDLAARGLDVPEVDLIINVDVPTKAKDYLHRVGRTARMENSGTAVSLVTPQEAGRIKRFEQELGITVHQARLFKGRMERIG